MAGKSKRQELTQRELRNESGRIMRALDDGVSFLLTRNGVPVGEVTPLRREQFTKKDVVLKAFANLPPIDAKQLRAEIDAVVDQDPTPRG